MNMTTRSLKKFDPIYGASGLPEALQIEFGALMLADAKASDHEKKLPTNAALNQGISVKQLVLDAIKKHGPISVRDVCGLVDRSETQLRECVNVLMSKGMLSKRMEGKTQLFKFERSRKRRKKLSQSEMDEIKADKRAAWEIADIFGIHVTSVYRVRRGEMDE